MNNKKIEIGDSVYYKGHGEIARRVRDIRGAAALIWGCSEYVPLSQLSYTYIEKEKDDKKSEILRVIDEALISNEGVVFEASKDGGAPVKVAIDKEALHTVRKKIANGGLSVRGNFEILGAELTTTHAKREWNKKMESLVKEFKELEKVRRL